MGVRQGGAGARPHWVRCGAEKGHMIVRHPPPISGGGGRCTPTGRYIPST